MQVQIKDSKPIIEIELQEPTAAASGKTLVVTSTHGNVVTDVLVE
jgi:actin-like ATPase involved in cell morphogenesis